MGSDAVVKKIDRIGSTKGYMRRGPAGGFLLLLVVFLCLASVLAADIAAVEMESRLPGTSGKERIILLSDLVYAYQAKEPRKALDYGQEALKLLRDFPEAKLEMALTVGISTACVWLGDYYAAETYARKSQAIAEKIGDKAGKANALYNIGWTLWSQGRYPQAKNYCARAHELYAEIEHQEGIAQSFQLRGMISWKLGDFSMAIEKVLDAIKIYETLSDKKGIADSKTMSGNISVEAGEYEKGLNYFSQAQRLYETLGEKTGMARTLNNTGVTYSKMGKPDEALKYFTQSLKIARQIGARNLISIVFSSIGEAYAQMGEYRQALTYFNQAIELDQKVKDQMGVAYNNIQIGIIKRKLGQYPEASQSLLHALKIAQKINIKNEIRAASKELAAVYEALGKHREALAYYQDYKNSEEEILNESSRKKIVEIQALYETDQKEKEILLLKKDRQLQQLELAQQKHLRKSYLIIILLVLLLAVVIYAGYHLKMRTTRALKKEICQHKQTAEKLRESEEKFRILAEKSAVGIAIIRDQEIKYANPAFLMIFAYPSKEVIGLDPLTLVMIEDQPLVRERLRSPGTHADCQQPGGPGFTGYEFRGLTKDGKVLHLESYLVQTYYHGQAAVLETVIDITQRKKIEMELLKMRKLESVGIMAGNIAYDFIALLAEITGNVCQLKKEPGVPPPLPKLLGSLEKISLKAKRLAQKLIIFSRGGEAAHREVTFAAVLKNATDAYPQLQKILGQISISSDLKPIYGDDGELSQVIRNLLWNAYEAIVPHKDAVVDITAKNILLLPDNTAALPAGEYIHAAVTDNGKGIPTDQLDKVFDPYFSTKETYHQKGMGLGLAICYSIIKKHKGSITIKSKPGTGTTVELLLPAYHPNPLPEPGPTRVGHEHGVLLTQEHPG